MSFFHPNCGSQSPVDSVVAFPPSLQSIFRMFLPRQSDISRQQLSAALHQLSGERRHLQRFLVPESVSAFLTIARDYAERTSAVNVGTC